MQAQQKVKAYELRNQNEENLVATLNKFRQELVALRTSKVSSAPQVKLARIRVSTLADVTLHPLVYCSSWRALPYPSSAKCRSQTREWSSLIRC